MTISVQDANKSDRFEAALEEYKNREPEKN